MERKSITVRIEGMARSEVLSLLEAAERAEMLAQCTREHYEDAPINFTYLSCYYKFPIGNTGIESTVIWLSRCHDERLRLVTPDEWVQYMDELAQEAQG